VDEGGAPERLGGFKLLTVPTPDGKLTPDLVATRIVRIGDEHVVQPGVVSVTQSTELGTRYSLEELTALAEHARAHGLLFHIDGSRLANAAAALGVELGDVAREADVISLGGTKIGLLAAEAVVVRNPELEPSLLYLRKQSMQLASKMRFVSAQLLALFEGDVWRRAAAHANAMAARLAAGVGETLTITQAVQANGVFAILPPGAAEQLQKDFKFYVWDEHTGEVRWMCSWDTTEDDVTEFAADVRRAAGHANAMARRLAEAVAHVEGVTLTQAVQANGVFAILPPGAAEQLQQDFKFYVWNPHTGEVRWMCSWDTTEEDVDAFVGAILGVVEGAVR
jgi:threonine aldolase